MTLNPLLDVKDLEKQKFVDDGSGNVAVRTAVVLDVEYSTTVSSTNVVLTNANTEYSHALPDSMQQLRFRARTGVDVRYAWVTGKVASLVSPYFTLPAGMGLAGDALSFTNKTLYFATEISGTIVEMEMLT